MKLCGVALAGFPVFSARLNCSTSNKWEELTAWRFDSDEIGPHLRVFVQDPKNVLSMGEREATSGQSNRPRLSAVTSPRKKHGQVQRGRMRR